jgi:hypothetical protein
MELFYRLRDIYKPPVFYAIERNKHGRIPDIKWLKERVRQAEARAARSSSEAGRFVCAVFRDEAEAMMDALARVPVNPTLHT